MASTLGDASRKHRKRQKRYGIETVGSTDTSDRASDIAGALGRVEPDDDLAKAAGREAR
jgi:hypothetical protein